MDIPSIRRETRYGMPAADHVIFNRHYILGYSYYFRQAKWALEIVNPDNPDLERLDNFRPDYRIPEMFRADLVDYAGSGYDRGHLIASANQRETELQNSETFLLSNMSPQKPQFNRQIWRELETRVRDLNAKSKIYETYVICGPIFYFDKEVTTIGAEDPNEVSIPIPHAYFKSVLAEDNRGNLLMWSFMIDNEDSDEPLESFLVSTIRVERYAGIKLWETLVGRKMDRERSRVRRMW
jgi:endonuclease G